MAADILVYPCIEKLSDNGVVHLSSARKPEPMTIHCRPHPLLEFRRIVYRASGAPGALNVCRTCLAKVGPHAVFYVSPALKPRQPKPGSAKAQTVAMFGEGDEG